jgi:hypothetical protein
MKNGLNSSYFFMEKLYKFGSNNFLDPAENDLSVVVIDLLDLLLSDIF